MMNIPLSCGRFNVKYTIVITSIGSSLGFIISEEMARDLGLKVGDRVKFTTTQVIRGGVAQNLEIYMKGKVISSGGKFGGFIISMKIAKQLRIERGIVLNIDIERER
nr:hypothetical protein [Candidatus Sigynarchaeota archaeon]